MKPGVRTRLYSRTCALLACVAMLGGCATAPQGERFSGLKAAPPDRCTLYVYRLQNFDGGGHSPKFIVGGVLQGALANGGYFRRELACGKHDIQLLPASEWVSFQPMQLSVNLEAGKPKFVRFSTRVERWDAAIVPFLTPVAVWDQRLYEVEASVALSEMLDTSAIEP